MGRSSLAPAALLLFLAVLSQPFSLFVGPRAPIARSARTQTNGWRFDWMLFGDGNQDGLPGLQTQDGYWFGEKGFEKTQAAQGLRYRMRPTREEVEKGIETEGYIQQFGPLKVKLGEAFGGTGRNPALRELRRKLSKEGITDPIKLAENEYWLARYGHKRWEAPYVNQDTGHKGFLRGLAAWSGFDPLKEEKGKTWSPPDWSFNGKNPWAKKYEGWTYPITKDQLLKEWKSGALTK